MASGLITDLSVIGTIDRTADVLEIVDVSANTSFKVTVNNLVGISGGSVVSTTDSQTLSNKILGNSNQITVLDGNFILQDNVDPTKQVQFQLSGNTTGTTRVYSFPDATGTLMDLASAQTASNKTFTSPTLTAPTITNATLSANTITGFTTSNTGNIYGIAVTAGQITGANTIGTGAIAAGAVGSAALATNAVQASQIATNAITLASISSSSSQGSISTSDVIVTGLTTTVTIPSGGRKVRVEGFVPSVANTSVNAGFFLSIYNSATVTGSPIQVATSAFVPVANTGNTAWVFWEGTPSAGSTSYCISLRTNTGTGSTTLSANTLAYLTVKVI